MNLDTGRGRRARVSGVASVGARLITLGAVLLAIRLASETLTAQELGLFVLVTGAQQLVAFADLGIGNGLVNVASAAYARDDDATLTEAASSAVAVLVLVAAAIGAGYALVARAVDWAATLGVRDVDPLEVRQAVTWLVAATAVSLPLGVAGNVYVARQQAWVTSTCAAVGSCAGVVGVAVLARSTSEPAPLAAVMLAATPIGSAIASALLYSTHPHLRPRLAMVRRVVSAQLVRHGALFFVLAVSVAVAYQSDAIILSRSRSAASVPAFSVAARLFLFSPMVIGLAMAPLWPAYREAVVRGDLEWVRRTLGRTLAGAAVAATAASILLLSLARPLVSRLVPDIPPPSWALLVTLGTWAVVSALSATLAVFLNGVGALRIQAVAAAAMAALNLGLSVALVEPLGAAGPVLASTITQTLVVLVPIAVTMRSFMTGNRADPSSLQAWLARHGDAVTA